MSWVLGSGSQHTGPVDTEKLAIDHVVMGVADLDAAAAELAARHGITALPGGTHPLWGTANRIVPLGTSYLELVAVVDDDVAAGSSFGSWVRDMAAGRCGWGFAVRTHDMAATAARLGLDPTPGTRTRPDGVVLTWQLAGVPEGAEARTLPFFIAWGGTTPMPGSAAVVHDCGDVALERLELEADAGRLTALLGGAALPLHVSPGRRGVTAVVLRTGAGAVTLTP
jgi:hypothetical protein